ncbi:GL25080 [Drosophila persimilis]|uniref:GL25080 n=2 Tax=Drosophila persimilis TaxID=7234 RepID=B4GQV2_DROPE|nr:GL25080 [Drosophila persimilis]
MSAVIGPKFILDFEKLKEAFAEICPDFGEEPSYEVASAARRFAEQVIFSYSKQARTAKAEKKDKTWIIRLDMKNEEGIEMKNEVHILTHFLREPLMTQPFVMRNQLLITFKQASLLAVHKYCQLVPHLVKRGETVLTPLAGAVFAKDDMPKLAEALGEPLAEVVMAVISSCQTDGYYLEHSRCHIAMVALVKTVADFKMRASIVKKTIKMYKRHGKEFDMDKFKVWSTFQRRSTPASSRSSTVTDGDEYDKLAEQVLAFQLSSKNEGEANQTIVRPKPPMKCAANFKFPKTN